MLPNVGAQELLIIFVIALVVVGPRRLPELGRAIGRGLNEFRKIQDEVRDMVKFDLSEDAPKFDLSEDPLPSTPRPGAPAALEAGSGVDEPDGPDDDPSVDPVAAPAEMTHSERVVALAAAEDAHGSTPEPAATAGTDEAAEEPQWIYDVMDDDEPDVEHPSVGSTE